jgi:hypothetical protein
MGWWSKTFYGVDLDEEQQRSDQTNAALASLNQQAFLSGKYDQKTYNEAERNRTVSYDTAGGANIAGDVSNTFWTSVDDNISSTRKGFGAIISAPFRLIPWQLWVIGAIALFIYMGGWVWLSRTLKGILK